MRTGSPPDQDALNRRVYHRPGVTRAYRATALDAAEASALAAYRAAFEGSRVLDVGVGTGRTTQFLAPVASRYVAIDYSPVMVRRVREAMPDVDVRHLDMRQLGVFAEGSFDCVLALANVLDAVSHDDRLLVLNDIHRVLVDGGTLIFSSHNRRYRRAESGPMLRRSRDPMAQVRGVAKLALETWNYLRLRRHRRWEAGYALLNDPGHHFAALHYYVDREVQVEQLGAAGFELVDAFARDGRRIGADDPSADTPDILYVARRVGPRLPEA
jgi:SAM-dependent methyltransferase